MPRTRAKSNAPLTVASIRNRKIFRDEGFDILLDYAIQQRFETHVGYTKLSHRFPDFDKFYWKPHRTVVIDDAGAKGGVQAMNIAHHALHYALMNTFAQDVIRMPLSTMLFECLASSLDIYFSLTYFNRYGMKHPFVRNRFRLFNEKCRRLGLDLVKLVNASAVDPFEAYRGCVEEMFTLLKISHRYSTQPRGLAYSFADDLCKHIDKLKYYGFVSAYDLHNFVIYARMQAVEPDGPKDTACIKMCLEKLRASKSMADFLSRLDLSHQRAPARERRAA